MSKDPFQYIDKDNIGGTSNNSFHDDDLFPGSLPEEARDYYL